MRDPGALQSLPEQFALCSSASPTAQRSLHLTGNASDPGTPNRWSPFYSPRRLYGAHWQVHPERWMEEVHQQVYTTVGPTPGVRRRTLT